jgi:hypothetical protein
LLQGSADARPTALDVLRAPRRSGEKPQRAAPSRRRATASSGPYFVVTLSGLAPAPAPAVNGVRGGRRIDERRRTDRVAIPPDASRYFGSWWPLAA